jgi:hypothetical protein
MQGHYLYTRQDKHRMNVQKHHASTGFRTHDFSVWVSEDISRLRPRGHFHRCIILIKKYQWPESASELYRPSDRRLSAKWLPTFADKGCHVVSVTDPYGRILDFLDRSRYYFFQVAPQLYSRGWVDPFPDPLFSENLVPAGIELGPLDL